MTTTQLPTFNHHASRSPSPLTRSLAVTCNIWNRSITRAQTLTTMASLLQSVRRVFGRGQNHGRAHRHGHDAGRTFNAGFFTSRPSGARRAPSRRKIVVLSGHPKLFCVPHQRRLSRAQSGAGLAPVQRAGRAAQERADARRGAQNHRSARHAHACPATVTGRCWKCFTPPASARPSCAILTVADANLEEELLRVNRGKGKKDRVVPLSSIACRFLENYIKAIRPETFARPGDRQAVYLDPQRPAHRRAWHQTDHQSVTCAG